MNEGILGGAIIAIPIGKMLSLIPTSTFWIIFLVLVVFVLVASLILVFHWNKYKLHSPATNRMQFIYIIGIVILLILSGATLLIYNLKS